MTETLERQKIESFRNRRQRTSSGNTIKKDGVRYVTFMRISLRTTREPCAKTHDNEKGHTPHTETLQVLCITSPFGKRMFSENFSYTSKPASRVVLGSRKGKNLRTKPKCNGRYALAYRCRLNCNGCVVSTQYRGNALSKLRRPP